MLSYKAYVTAGLSVVCWVLVVIVLAEENSLYTGFGGGCGLFECTSGKGRTDWDLPYACSSRVDHIKAAQGFGTMTAIFTGLAMLLHVGCAAVPHALPPSKGLVWVQPLHAVSVLFSVICWTCMVGAYTSKLCDRRISDAPSTAVGYGIFFMCGVTAMEFTSLLICVQHVKEEGTDAKRPVELGNL